MKLSLQLQIILIIFVVIVVIGTVGKIQTKFAELEKRITALERR